MSATGRSDVRRADDFYATPAWCTRALLRLMPPNRMRPQDAIMFDPCAGDGAILRVGSEAGVSIAGFELDPARAALAGVPCRDALSPEPWGVPAGSMVVTNPPYTLAMEFVQRALRECDRVAMLLRLPWLASQGRAAWLRAHTPAVAVLPKRPSFTGKGTDSTDYAWMVWGCGAPRVYILDTAEAA